MFFPGNHVEIVSGEHEGQTGVVTGIITMYHKKEVRTYRILLDGFPIPGGWNGKITAIDENLKRISST